MYKQNGKSLYHKRITFWPLIRENPNLHLDPPPQCKIIISFQCLGELAGFQILTSITCSNGFLFGKNMFVAIVREFAGVWINSLKWIFNFDWFSGLIPFTWFFNFDWFSRINSSSTFFLIILIGFNVFFLILTSF